MNLSGNTILITGGTSGIGLELAKAFRAKGNDVIVSGRREQLLQEIQSKHPGIVGRRLDATDLSEIQQFAKRSLLRSCRRTNSVLGSVPDSLARS